MNDLEELLASEETNAEIVYKSEQKSCEKYNDLVFHILDLMMSFIIERLRASSFNRSRG
jgi:hypothetical protein